MKKLEYLPKRMPCEDGRLRMVYVRGFWENARWTEDAQPDGTPGYRLFGGRYTRGFVRGGRFQSLIEENAA